MSRIVYFQQDFPRLTETFVRAEISELIRRGYEVFVLTLQKNRELASCFPYPERVIEVSHRGSYGSAIEALVAAARELSPTYLHVHFVTEARNFLAPIAENLGVPFGFTCHAADIWLRGNRLEPEELSLLSRHPLCITAAVEGTRHYQYLKWCGVDTDKLVITPNSVDRVRLPPLEQKTSERLLRLVAVGRPVLKKGFFVAVDAFRLLRLSGYPFELEIVGGGDVSAPLGGALREYVRDISFVDVTELLANDLTLEKIRTADALIMPSIIAPDGDSDGIPTVLIEAMLMGVPVVSTDVGSITDLVLPGETGFIARSGDPASLAEQILELEKYFQEPEMLENLRQRAYRRALRHEAQASVNQLVVHLEKCLGRFSGQAATYS